MVEAKRLTNVYIIAFTRKNQYICNDGKEPHLSQRMFQPLYMLSTGLRTLEYLVVCQALYGELQMWALPTDTLFGKINRDREVAERVETNRL